MSEQNSGIQQPQVSIEKELRKSYLEYSLSVIIGRAIPDARDGLKPVHRRIMYAQYELANSYNRPHKKSARIVGDVIGKYHPHGDSAVYDALVRLAQDFSMRDPLVDGQGNFGSIDGDAAAAMRYTEVRMSRLASEFLADIDKETVDFRPNYDNTLQEPSVLPTKVPNLLLNGSSGIAVGMATNIPPHNLGELCDALQMLLDDPQCTISDLMEVVKGPDFPTRGFVYAGKGLSDAYHTGRGTVKVRGRLEVEERKKGLQAIVIREIPFGLNKSSLVEKIAGLVNDHKIDGISDLRDESDRKGIRVVIDLKRGTIPDIVINSLYKYTPLETSFGINMLAVVDNRPVLLNLKTALAYFLDHRREVVVRRTKFELRKAEARAKAAAPVQKVSLENLFDQIQAGERKELALIVKADVQGSVEAVKASLEKLSNDEVNVRVIHGGVGAINESDVMLAASSNAIIVGFNVRPDAAARDGAIRQNVDMRMYRVIYDCIDEITAAMKGMLAPKFREVVLGHAEVRQTYKVSSVGTVAGCYVQDGKIVRNCSVRVVRDGIVIHEGALASLKRFKDDAKEVAENYECGLTVEKFNDIKEGDIIEAFTMEEIPR